MHFKQQPKDVKGELTHRGRASAPDRIFNNRNASGTAGQVAQA